MKRRAVESFQGGFNRKFKRIFLMILEYEMD